MHLPNLWRSTIKERFPIQSYPPKIPRVIRFTAKDVAKMFFGSIAVEVGVIRSD